MADLISTITNSLTSAVTSKITSLIPTASDVTKLFGSLPSKALSSITSILKIPAVPSIPALPDLSKLTLPKIPSIPSIGDFTNGFDPSAVTKQLESLTSSANLESLIKDSGVGMPADVLKNLAANNGLAGMIKSNLPKVPGEVSLASVMSTMQIPEINPDIMNKMGSMMTSLPSGSTGSSTPTDIFSLQEGTQENTNFATAEQNTALNSSLKSVVTPFLKDGFSSNT